MRAVALSIVLAPLLAACGARSALEVPVVVSDGADAASTTSTSASSNASGFGDASVDAAPPPVPNTACAVGPSGVASPIAAVNAGGVVSFVDGQNRVTTPYTFPPTPAGMDREYALIASRGGYVAAAISDVDAGDDALLPSVVLRVVLLEIGGGVVFSGEYTLPYQADGAAASLVGNASGLFVFSLNAGGVTFSPRGGKGWPDTYLGIGDPDDAGRLLVVDTNSNSSEDYYWFDTARQTFTPTLFLSSGPTAGAAIYGDALAYVTSKPATVWVETASGRTAVSQGNAWQPEDYPSLNVANGAAWGVACWGSATSLLATFDLSGGPSGVPFTVVAPAGETLLNPGYVTTFDSTCPYIDSAGRPYEFFEGPRGLALFATTDGTNWDSVGSTIAGVSTVAATESGGTYLIGGSAIAGPPFLGPDGGAGVSVGPQLQVVRPVSGAHVTLPQADWTNQTYPSYVMTGDGHCVAYFENGALTIADAVESTIHTTALTADTANDSLSLGWTNIPGDHEVWTELGD
jgi:hypothetical protein